MISNFNNWLFENGHMQYLEVNEYYEECKNCNTWDADLDALKKLENQKNNVF